MATLAHPASHGVATVATIFAAIYATLAESQRLADYIANQQAERADALASLED